MRSPRLLVWSALLLCLSGCSVPHSDQKPPVPEPPATGGLYDDLGTHHRTITTRSPLAQRWFD
jgi:hypothetical protein